MYHAASIHLLLKSIKYSAFPLNSSTDLPEHHDRLYLRVNFVIIIAYFTKGTSETQNLLRYNKNARY